jgi:uncharacterized membrane protein
MNHVYLLAIGIGIVAGLRSLTAPAFVSWAAHLGWLNLQGTSLAFMGSAVAAWLFTLLAIIELVADQLPKTPARTAPVGLIARIIMGGLCGGCLCVAANQGIVVGVILGILGALIGTYGGYYARTGLVSGLKVKDVLIAIPEDIVAIVLAYCIVK